MLKNKQKYKPLKPNRKEKAQIIQRSTGLENEH